MISPPKKKKNLWMCSKNVCIYECIFIEVTCCCGRTHDTSKVMTNNDCLTFYVGYDLSRGPSLSYLYVSFTAMMWLISLCQPLDHYVGTLLIEPFFFFFSFFFFKNWLSHSDNIHTCKTCCDKSFDNYKSNTKNENWNNHMS